VKRKLRKAFVKSLRDITSGFGKAVTLAGTLAIAGNYLKLPVALEVTLTESFALIFVGFLAMMAANLIEQGV